MAKSKEVTLLCMNARAKVRSGKTYQAELLLQKAFELAYAPDDIEICERRYDYIYGRGGDEKSVDNAGQQEVPRNRS